MIRTLTFLFALFALVACGEKADDAAPDTKTPATTSNPADKTPPAKTDGGATATKTVTLQIDGMT